MANRWIVDMHHYLSDDGLPVVRRGTLVPFLGAIVEAVSAVQGTEAPMADVRCRRRPRHQPCSGIIDAFIEPDTQAIEWYCPACGDDGYIANWMRTPWDCSPAHAAPPASASASHLPYFTPAADRTWNRLPGSLRVRLLNNVFCVQCLGGTSMALEGATVTGDDLVLSGTCTTCGHGVTRVVEQAAKA
jgi:predicted RNA-binding Zn-ribbon protein involved in translation (DUF1610 family)